MGNWCRPIRAISVKCDSAEQPSDCTSNSSSESLIISSILNLTVLSTGSPNADDLTYQRGANQHAALFIPMPNSQRPERSGGNCAGRKALGKSPAEMPAALSLTVIRPPSVDSISL